MVITYGCALFYSDDVTLPAPRQKGDYHNVNVMLKGIICYFKSKLPCYHLVTSYVLDVKLCEINAEVVDNENDLDNSLFKYIYIYKYKTYERDCKWFL